MIKYKYKYYKILYSLYLKVGFTLNSVRNILVFTQSVNALGFILKRQGNYTFLKKLRGLRELHGKIIGDYEKDSKNFIN